MGMDIFVKIQDTPKGLKTPCILDTHIHEDYSAVGSSSPVLIKRFLVLFAALSIDGAVWVSRE